MSKKTWNRDYDSTVRDEELLASTATRCHDANCNCGWEVRFGYGVAVTLAIFEAKRFFMLALEMMAEWQVIRFAGGLRPVILTLLDVCLGLPSAVIAIRTIRRQRIPPCCSKTRRILRCLLVMVTACAALNVATLASIGYHISVKQETLIDIFNASMHLYASAASYKYTIDEIQFIFQCCGHTSYADWFFFDWQRVDYAPRDDMSHQNRISDEEFRYRGVPFSCCSLNSIRPCVHVEMIDSDIKTINKNGCAEVISPILVRIVVVAYIMTSTLVVTQALLVFLIVRMIDNLLVKKRLIAPSVTSTDGSSSLLLDPSRTCVESNSKSKQVGSSLSFRTSGPSVKIKRSSKSRTKGTRNCASSVSLSKTTTTMTMGSAAKKTRLEGSREEGARDERSTLLKPLMETRFPQEAASIKPSVHEEHRIERKHFSGKRASLRVN